MLTREQVKQKWIEIIESVHKEKVFSSVEGAWQLAQWVESQYEESGVYLALLGQVNAAITFETEEQARESKYGLPPDLAQAIYTATTRGYFPTKEKPNE